MVKKVPIAGAVKVMFCPGCMKSTLHKFIGWYYKKSQWECQVCGRVILGDIYKT